MHLWNAKTKRHCIKDNWVYFSDKRFIWQMSLQLLSRSCFVLCLRVGLIVNRKVISFVREKPSKMNSIICYHIWLEGRMVAINIATNHLRRFNPSCYKSIWNILCTSLPLSLWSELFLRKNLILVFCVVLSGWEQWAVEPTKEKKHFNGKVVVRTLRR